MFYAIAKAILFRFNPELSHTLALKSLQMAYKLGLLRLMPTIPLQPRTIMGLNFPNPIGLAAGLDKNADYIDAVAQLGFGFIEVGTVTPKPQNGNPRPRLFRLLKQEAIINRMGFNNKGIAYVVKQLQNCNYQGILGINIGKNKDSTDQQIIADYLEGFRAFWPYASYITLNISSPNTPGLRDLQQRDSLQQLLIALKQEQATIATLHHKYVPLVVKIAPDLTLAQLQDLATVLLNQKIDGIIATNTTLQRDGVEESPYVNEAGGLSGRPLHVLSTALIKQLHNLLQNKIPIIASGGVMDENTAIEKITAGASLVQLYSGLIYRGPTLVHTITKALAMLRPT